MATALIISPEFNPMQGDQDRTDREMAKNEEVPKQSIEEIVREIKGEVADRRSVGDYPIGLEQQLEKYFSDMMRSLHERDLATKPMLEAIEKLQSAMDSFTIAIPRSSKVPGVALVHSLFARLNHRHAQNLADQVQRIGDLVITIQQEFIGLANQIYEHDARDSSRVLSSVGDQLAVVDHLAHLSVEFETRIRKLEERA